MKLTLLSFFAAISLMVLSSCRDHLTGPSISSSDTVAFWPFDGNLNDVTGNGHDGAFVGTPSTPAYGPDRFGNANHALVLNGQAPVEVANKTDLDFTGGDSFTITAWIKTPDVTFSDVVAKGPEDGSYPGYQLGMNKAFEPGVTSKWAWANITSADNPSNASWSGNAIVPPNLVVCDNIWHMLTLVVDAHAGASLYTDSVLEDHVSDAALEPELDNLASLLIGGSPNRENFFQGSIDEVMILHRALDPAEVAARFHEGGWYEHTDTVTQAQNGDTTNVQFVKTSGKLLPVTYAVCFPNPKDGYASGIYGSLAASHDSGMTWTTQNSGIYDDLLGISFNNVGIGIAVGGRSINGGMIIRSTNSGGNWGQPNFFHPPNSSVLEDVKFLSDGVHAICVGIDTSNNGIIYVSADAGATWNLAKQTPHPLKSIATSNSMGQYAVVVGDSGSDFSTMDMGNTWNDNSSGTSNYIKVSLDPSSGTAYDAVAISSGSAFWSTDMGRGWEQYSVAGNTNLIAVYAAGGGEAWALNETNSILETVNRSVAWTNRTPSFIGQGGPWWNCIAARDLHHVLFVAQDGELYWLTR
ncbi:MAG TPA: LamG-like jellyroll fold domain-containing protein [Candidatus Kapabacteria bacterium]|jgi:photosystem II stability/assembly factor-like uncharacterized protein